MSEGEEEFENSVPTDILETAKSVSLNLLPEKSKRQYAASYNQFKKWRQTKNFRSFSEEVLIVYFNELSKDMKPLTLWADQKNPKFLQRMKWPNFAMKLQMTNILQQR